MQRVRIRSMINQIKSHQAYVSARKNKEQGRQDNFNSSIQTNQQKFNLNHSCFILKPIDQINLWHETSTIYQDKRNHITSAKQKESKGKSRKIANKSYLSTINPKSKEEFQNLQQLGIRTKKITGRNMRKTQTAFKINFETVSDLNSEEVAQKRERKKYLKSPVVEYFHRNRSLPDKKMHVIYEDPKSQYQKNHFGFNIETVKPRIQRFAKIKGLTIKIPKTSRKNSDITPWELESPLIKV